MSGQAAASHAAYDDNCRRIAVDEQRVGGRCVQVLTKGVVLCGQVVGRDRFGAPEREWFKVATPLRTGWMPADRVRLCDLADDRCTCSILGEGKPALERVTC